MEVYWNLQRITTAHRYVWKVENIKKRFAEASDQERPFLAARIERYDAVWVQLAKSALKQVRPKFQGDRDWSPTFALKGAICRHWNHHLRIFYTRGHLDHRDIPIPAKYSPPKVTCEEDLVQHHMEALHEWHTKGNAAALRVQHLEDLIQYHMDQRNLKREQAVKEILHWEEVQNLHSWQSSMMTRSKPNVIKTLLILRPHSTDPYAMMEITNPDHIQQVTQRSLEQHMGRHSPWILLQRQLDNTETLMPPTNFSMGLLM